MMWANISLWVLVIYIGLFIWHSLRQRQWLWLWLAVLLWLGFAVLNTRLLPEVFGLMSLVNIYAPHVYVVPASVCLWLLAWRQHPKGGWHMRHGGHYLTLLAVSGVLQYLSFALLLLLVRFSYPTGLTLYVWPTLWYQYWLQPVFWIGSQWLLMLLFYVHRRLDNEAIGRFSWPQLQMGFLISLLMQALFVLVDLGTRFAGI